MQALSMHPLRGLTPRGALAFLAGGILLAAICAGAAAGGSAAATSTSRATSVLSR
jgi:hypothetical protein